MNRHIVRNALVIGMLAGVTTFAQATAQGQLTLSGFSYTLKDLNVSDGQAPSLTWGDARVGYTLTASEQHDWTLQNGGYYPNFQPEGMGIVSEWSLDSMSGSFFGTTASATLTAGILSRLDLTSVSEPGHRDSSDASMGVSFTLAASSSVTFTYLIDASISGTSGAGLWPAGGPILGSGEHSSASYGVVIRVGNVGNSVGGSGNNNWSTSASAYDTSISGQPIQFTVRNTNTTAQTYSLSVTGSLYTEEIMAPSAPLPAVPEPASYALMTIGLTAIAAAAMRRRKDVAC